MKNLPNSITVSRVILVFFFVIFANVNHENKIKLFHITEDMTYACHIIAIVIALIAGLSDLLDGYLARRFKVESDFGRLMDPLADKIFILATYVMMVEYHLMPAWIVIVILSREFMVTGLRLLASSKGLILAADKWGKIKTSLQMFTLAVGGAAWINLFNLEAPKIWGAWYILLLIVTAVTIFSGFSYFYKNKKLFMEAV